MALDLETALSQYGLVGLYAKNNPEINKVLQTAIAQEWDSARFERALWDTNWWKTLTEQHRLLDVMRVTDPATYKSTIDTKKAQVAALAGRLGMTVDVNHWAQIALRNNWDDATLQYYLASDSRNRLQTVNNGVTGMAGEVEAHVRQVNEAYGVPLSGARLQQVIKGVLAGTMTTGGYDNEVRNAAKKMYPQWQAELDLGLTLMDIADPYIQTMANTLEIPDSTINLRDAAIKQALNFKDKNGAPTIKPLWQFEQDLKNDPRWDKTKNAVQDTYAILGQIGKDWGFV